MVINQCLPKRSENIAFITALRSFLATGTLCLKRPYQKKVKIL